MSCLIHISMPGLTCKAARELDRRAHVAGAPFQFKPPRRSGFLRRIDQPGVVVMKDLSEDPAIGSETLDHSDGWPQDGRVQDWLVRAMRFLGENAPEHRFIFQAGWNEHTPTGEVELDLEAFVASIRVGRLRVWDRYDVRVTDRTR
jgi:hypothetical protein